MKLIPFPGAEVPPRYKKVKAKITKQSSPNDRLVVGPFEFTCINCRTTNKFSMEGMIFRQVDFYCSCCGHLYKVTNPAFTPPTPSK